MSKFVKLLARLESKNKKKWIDLYEDRQFSKPTYYYSMYNGGGDLGGDLKAAAAKVCEIAAKMGRLYRIDVSTVTE